MGSCRSFISAYVPGSGPPGARASASPLLHGPGICPGKAAGTAPASDLNSVGLGCLHQRIHNGTGLCAFHTVAEQPILSSYHKGADGIFSQVVGDRYISIVQECHELLLLVQRIPNCILQLASLFWMDRFQPCKILLQKGPNHILAVFFTSFDICIYVFLLQGEQLRTVLESNCCFACLHRSPVRHGFPRFSSGMSPASAVGDFLHLVVSRVAIRYQSSGEAF